MPREPADLIDVLPDVLQSPRDPAQQRRALRVLAAGVVSGGLTILLVKEVLLPQLKRFLLEPENTWMIDGLAANPWWLAAGVLGLTGVLALPVLAACWWAARPQP